MRCFAEELEAAVGENAALREAVARGGRAKEQVDQLLDALRREREAHHSAAQQAQRAQEDCARAQQRVRCRIPRSCFEELLLLLLWNAFFTLFCYLSTAGSVALPHPMRIKVHGAHD